MKPRAAMTDRQLLESYAASGDTESLGAFFKRHEHSLLRFTGRFLGDRHAAQDVVQQTFMQVARHPKRLLKAGSCHNGLLRVARTIGARRIQGNSRSRRRTGILTHRRRRKNPQAIDADERTRRIQKEIDRLDPRKREIILLKILEEKSYQDIAEITGLTATNVGHLLHRAMRELVTRFSQSKEVL
jgi:RNA polymerase sigma-70 factor (ECF subfamily)